MKKLFVLASAFVILAQVAFAITYINTLNNNNQSIGNYNSIFIDNTNSRAGIGTTSPQSNLHVNGSKGILVSPRNPQYVAKYSSSTYLQYAYSVYVSGKYAYVSSWSKGLSIIDVSNPANPVFISNLNSTVSGSIPGIQVVGKYAYLTSYYTKGLLILDVSNPANASLVGYYNDSTYINNLNDVYVSGKYAYVTSGSTSAIVIIDISNATSPKRAGNYTDPTRLYNPGGIYVSGRYAYATVYSNYSLVILDVSDATNPKFAGVYRNTSLLDGVLDVAVVGRYAYVVSYNNKTLSIIDISNSSNPVLAGYYYSSTYLNGAVKLKVVGKYAYVASYVSGSITMIDISNASNPVFVGVNTTWISGAQDIDVSGKYAYVASYGDSALAIFELSGLNSPTASIGDIETSHLSVTDNANVHNNLYVDNALNVGPGGLYTDAGNGISTDGNLTVYGFLGVGTSQPEQEVHVVGNDPNNNVIMRAQMDGDNYAGIELKSNSRIWGFSKRPGAYSDRFDLYYHNSTDWLGPYITITSAGNVGIGDTNSQYKFTIIPPSGTPAALRIKTTDENANVMNLSITGYPATLIRVNSAGDYQFWDSTGTYNNYYLTQSGNAYSRGNLLVNGYVGIGDSSPVSSLVVGSDAGYNSGLAGTGSAYIQYILEVEGPVYFIAAYNYQQTSGVLAVIPDSTGRVYGYSASSIRYKENISDLDLGLDAVLNFRPVDFYYKRDAISKGQRHQVGFVAEDMENVSPLLVIYENYSSQENYIGSVVQDIRMDRINTVVVKAVQEQQGRIDNIRSENERLRLENDAIRAAICGIDPDEDVCA